MEKSTRVCLLINNDPFEQAIFTWAFHDLYPNSVCCVACDGAEAFELMEHLQIIPDFIFAELDMPGMDAVALMEKMKEHPALSRIPVVVHANYPAIPKMLALRELGVLAIFFKKIDFQTIRNILSLYFLPDTCVLLQN